MKLFDGMSEAGFVLWRLQISIPKIQHQFFNPLSPSVKDAATYVAALCINKVCKVLVWSRTFGRQFPPSEHLVQIMQKAAHIHKS